MKRDLAWLVLGGLVGLRPYEVLRLEWTGFHFKTREIRIEPSWTKTHRARVIPLQQNAGEWLQIMFERSRKDAGKVMPAESTWNNRWRRWFHRVVHAHKRIAIDKEYRRKVARGIS